jgi:hypothetical protein
VNIREGTYRILDSTSKLPTLLTFTAQDSGESQSWVVYRAYNNEDVHMTGSFTISAQDWSPANLSFSPFAYSVNLIKLFGNNIMSAFGELASGSLGSCANDKLELFYDGQPMVLARYPNLNGYVWTWENIANLVSGDPNSFYFDLGSDNNRSLNWVNEVCSFFFSFLLFFEIRL